MINHLNVRKRRPLSPQAKMNSDLDKVPIWLNFKRQKVKTKYVLVLITHNVLYSVVSYQDFFYFKCSYNLSKILPQNFFL